MVVQFNGLNVDFAPFTIVVQPEATTTAAVSSITDVSLEYSVGDYLSFLIIAKDSFGNLRPLSVSEVFTATLTELTSSTVIALSPVSNNNGTYSVSH